MRTLILHLRILRLRAVESRGRLGFALTKLLTVFATAESRPRWHPYATRSGWAHTTAIPSNSFTRCLEGVPRAPTSKVAGLGSGSNACRSFNLYLYYTPFFWICQAFFSYFSKFFSIFFNFFWGVFLFLEMAFF